MKHSTNLLGVWLVGALDVWLGSVLGFWRGFGLTVAISLLVRGGYWLAKREEEIDA